MTDVDPPQDLSVANDGAVVVGGDLDVVASTGLATALAERAQETAGPFVVDLSAVTFIDSSGLRVLLQTEEVCRSRAGAMILRNPSPPVRRLLELTGLTTALSIDSAAG